MCFETDGDEWVLPWATLAEVDYLAATRLGPVDAVVMVHAERLKARAIVTLDARHFRAVKLAGNPKLIPLDD